MERKPHELPRRLEDLANRVGGQLVGGVGTVVSNALPFGQVAAGQITMLDHQEPAEVLSACPAAAFVIPADLPWQDPRPVIRSANVHAAFGKIVQVFRPHRAARPFGISPQATVDPTATIGRDVTIHPAASIGPEVTLGDGCIVHAGVRVMAGCQLGPGVVLFPNAVLYPDTKVGQKSIIHAGAIIGAYGFGYRTENGRHEPTAQLGWVEIGEFCEIGANSTIDRGTYGPTRIGNGTKIDNLVQVAHNCQVGEHNLLCSQVGMAGSCTTGDYVVMAGQCGISDHIHIGTGSVLGAMSGIMRDVPEGSRLLGIPATPERDQMVLQANLAKLPEMRRQLRELEKLVAKLQNSGGSAHQEAA